MKKLLFLLSFILVSMSMLSQNDNIENMSILSCGNSELTNNECVIKLKTPSENYHVILTPIGEYSQLYVSKKSNNDFTVKSKDMINCSFDYIIIERKIKYMESDYIDERKIK